MGITPSTGNTYFVLNAGNNSVTHVLDDNGEFTNDGNPILSWSLNSPQSNNQIWQYLTYPTSSNDTVFTLQAISTINANPGFGGRGGYITVDKSTQQLVQSGAPQAWKLEPANFVDLIAFVFVPFDDSVSANGVLVATDINPVIVSPSANTVQLTKRTGAANQGWIFSTATPNPS